MPHPTDRPTRRLRGFERAARLLEPRIRRVGEKRGFAETRLLTHWAEIAGEEVARIARPVDVRHGREGFGATLTLLTTGAHAPLLEMQKETIRERVNACYGYAAISRIRLTQTAPTGFAEGRAAFDPAPAPARAAPAPEVQEKAAALAGSVHDPDLRAALDALGRNVLSRSKR